MEALLDLLFPPRCPGCRALVQGKGPFCRVCRETFTELPEQRCPRCSEPDVQGLCVHCLREPPPFELALTPFLYGGALADAVHRFKYEDCPHYARALAEVGRPFAAEALSWCEWVVPVPLHERRLRSRGYDQALLLARALAAGSGRETVPRAIRRARETSRQVGRDRAERRRNVDQAFVPAVPLQGRKVLLVDDVLTTGATASAASAALLEGGAAAVRVFALARAF